MTVSIFNIVIPAQAGIQSTKGALRQGGWTPAFAGVTIGGEVR